MWSISYLGSGSYSSVLRADIRHANSGAVFSCAIAVSLVDAGIYGDRLGPKNHDAKEFAEVIPEVAGGLLVTSLRVPGFVPYHQTFVVGGVSFMEHMRDSSLRSTVLGKICTALSVQGNRRRDFYMHVPIQNTHVMLVFMGLADGGDLLDGIHNAAHPTDLVRQWSFTLLWSLLAAQRVFSFEHRDIKAGNIMLHNAGAGESHFFLDTDDDDDDGGGIHFAVVRGRTGLSAYVPKFIDMNFCSYAFTGVDPDAATLQDVGEAFHDTIIFGNVNKSTKWLATYPSPDMLFMSRDAERDFDSDVFSFGIVLFEMCCRVPNFLINLDTEETEQEFIALWDEELAAQPVALRQLTFDEADTIESGRSAVMVLRYMWLLQVLGHGFWPSASSPLAESPLYALLNRPALRAFLDDLVPPRVLVDEVRWMEETRGAPLMDFLRACLTWEKSTRGVFEGGPLARPQTPASFRLMMHDFFRPLRSTATNVRAEDTHNLHYKDPVAYHALDSVSRKGRKRIFDRIHAIETFALAQVSTVLTTETFATAAATFAAKVLGTFDTPLAAPATLQKKLKRRPREEALVADTDAGVSPIGKRARTFDTSSATQDSTEHIRLYADEEELNIF